MRLAVILLALSTAACAGYPQSAKDEQAVAHPATVFGDTVRRSMGVEIHPIEPQVSAGIGISGAIVPQPDPQADRKIIFNGGLLLQVADGDAAEKELRKAAEGVKGWIHKIDGPTFTLRVPAAQFMATMETVAKLGRVLDRKVAGTDVTEQVQDLQLRLENAEKLRTRIAALLEKTKDVKEALEVERELSRVTEEVERLKGKLNAMNDAVTYSTVVVTLQRSAAPAKAAAAPRYPFPWIRALGLDSLMDVRER